MIRFFKESFKRKKARRVTQEYPYKIDTFDLEKDGIVKFANWENPLVSPIRLTQSEIDFFRKFIKKGDVVIDIGANIGDTTVPMAIAAGKEGVTFGFEPNPYVYKILEANAQLNENKSNIIPLLNAISVKEEEFYYTSSEASFSNGGISPDKDNSHGKFVYPGKVKGINLLKYLKESHPDLISRISFIKVDTEGYDKEILKSISDLITTCKPSIVAESFGKSTDEEKMELFDVISQHGYEIFYFEDFTTEAKTLPIKESREMTAWKDTINIYAIPTEAKH
jgi:FkbM family methyltransferase